MEQARMVALVERHLKAEGAGDVDAAVDVYTDDVEHDVVGFPTGVLHGRDAARGFYEELTANFRTEDEQPGHRYFSPDAMVLDQEMTGTVIGTFLGLPGNDRRITFRVLHVFEFRNELISRENVWLDVAAIQQQLSQPSHPQRRDPAMQRTDVNPWEWSKAFGYSQAVDVSGGERVLFCAGQTATGADGAPPTTTDMAEQVTMAFASLQTVLAAADMTTADIARLTVYTTDVDALLAAYGSLAGALAPNLPAMTLIGVARLAFPELKVEIEATAVR